MAETKSTLIVCIQPAVKEGVRTVAEKERRSLANMIEVMVSDYCHRHGVTVEKFGATN